MSSDLLQRLAAAGTPMDLIMEVAETLAEARAAERLLEKRREKDRERKRFPRNSTETTECAETSETPSPFEVSPQTPLPKTPNQISPLNPPKFMVAWNTPAKLHGLPLISSIAGSRLKALRARIKDHGEQGVLQAIDAVFQSKHWLGENDRGWLGNFDSMLRPDNFVRLIEGTYGPKQAPIRLLKAMTPEEMANAIRYHREQGNKAKAEELEAELSEIVGRIAA